MKKYLLIAACLCATSTPVFAQVDFEPEQLEKNELLVLDPTGPKTTIPAGLLYASFDADGDYLITASELSAGIASSFKTADSNNNDVLSLVELDLWRAAALGSRDVLPGNTQFDKNFDSRISAGEFSGVLSRIFTSADKNGDGVLGFDELTRDLPARAARPRAPRPPAFAPTRSDRSGRTGRTGRRPGY